jgi:hypothetical protein
VGSCKVVLSAKFGRPDRDRIPRRGLWVEVGENTVFKHQDAMYAHVKNSMLAER